MVPKQRLNGDVVEQSAIADHLRDFLQGQPSVVLSVPAVHATAMKSLETALVQDSGASQVQGQPQLEADVDDLAPVNSLEPVRDTLYFRVVPLRIDRQKVVAMPASRAAKLKSHELCVTRHSAHRFGDEHIVSVEAEKAVAAQNPVSVLSLWNVELASMLFLRSVIRQPKTQQVQCAS